ncbi:multiple epidermal growth factor-like domains protein 9 [Denticeps clupeoides]|uniref:Laminin EGF-like domain-containing protein n=1 Tax=Denticeps clupeoides TaxID=299321 RepID=A0AAY3ZTX5_9TELE|nr:multiple epidermal growth factor-like domains protein 9 [Denticeps clupeoides]XP_028828956.1 multiple epidermal growth factor-like domains protein 9 [Denticeps clupeoides]
MKCRQISVPLPPTAPGLLLLLCLVGPCFAAGDNNASPVRRHQRAVRDAQLELRDTSTMPNHLSEDGLALSTPAPGTAATAIAAVSVGQAIELPASTKTMETTTARRDATTHAERATDKGFWEITVRTTSSPLRDLTIASTGAPVPTNIDTRQELQCNCSTEGTEDMNACDPVTGQCVCTEGYTGLLCDVCEDGFFNNGSTGCLPCGCDSYGAASPTCDSSGICECKTGVYGDKCDDCLPGFFHFSSTGCQHCQCNNHSSYCHPQSGICVNCQGNTKGPSCEECKYNFFRLPGSALTESCPPCPCSSVTSTGSCHLDKAGRPVCDQCNPEYLGPNCEQCKDGFYNADSICIPCNCSGNADPRTSPRTCHPDTGHCLSCIHNTTGQHCERCAAGFTGDALKRTCRPNVKVLPEPDLRTTPARVQSSTMTTTTANETSRPTPTQTLLTTLGTPIDNTTAAAEVSWTQFNIIILAVIIVVVVALMGVAGGIYTYREYQNRKLNAPFWTIELKEDNISFSSYHDSIPNADVSGLLEDEGSDVAPNGQLALSSPASMYKA